MIDKTTICIDCEWLSRKKSSSAGWRCGLICCVALTLSGCGRVAPIAPPLPLPADHSASNTGYTGQQLDSADSKAINGFADQPDLPVLAPADPEQMPAYGGAELPGSSTPLTLAQVYTLAFQNAPNLRAEYNELQAVRHDVGAARSGLFPKIFLEGTYTKVDSTVKQSDNTVYAHGSASWPEKKYALTLEQPLFDLGVYEKWRRSQAQEREAVASYAVVQQDLMLRVATGYFSILAAQDQMRLAQAEQETSRKQLQVVQARYQAGQVTSVDLGQVQARLEVQQANYLLAQSKYEDKKQELLQLIGYADINLQPIAAKLDLMAPDPNNANAWVRTALQQSWAIRKARAAVHVAQKNLSVQHALFYPTVNLKASTGENRVEGSLFGGGSTIDDTRIMINLKMPLFQGGYVISKSGAAGSRLAAARMKLSAARRKAQRQVVSAYKNIRVGIKRVPALQQSVDSFEQVLGLKQKSYRSGLTDIVSVLDAAKNLFDAKRQLAAARYNYLLDTLKLKQASGTLSGGDVEALSQELGRHL